MINQTHDLILSFVDFFLINVIVLLNFMHKLWWVYFLIINLLLICHYAACLIIFHTEVWEHLIFMFNEIYFKTFIHFLNTLSKLFIWYLLVHVIIYFLVLILDLLRYLWIVNKNIKKQMEHFISWEEGCKKIVSFIRNNKNRIVKNKSVVSFLNFENIVTE